MEKLLIVCGPTATGKTALAIALAKKYNGELINADSRQLYEGLDVVTGKDLPQGALPTIVEHVSYEGRMFSIKTYDIGVPIWLYDLVPPDISVSIALYQLAARIAIKHIRAKGKLPILVGGSGLYIRSVVENIETITVPQHVSLRDELSQSTVETLQNRLQEVDMSKFNEMNHSDKNNPRRLIRAIEVAEFYKAGGALRSEDSGSDQVMWVGLRHSEQLIDEVIIARVQSRWLDGAVEEVRGLLVQHSSTSLISALGVGPIQEFIEGKCNEVDAKASWAREEVAYAKRQIVWFKKNMQIHWFDVVENTLYDQVEANILPWYTTS